MNLQLLTIKLSNLIQNLIISINRSPVNASPLVCHLPELRDNPDYYSQITRKDMFYAATMIDWKKSHDEIEADGYP